MYAFRKWAATLICAAGLFAIQWSGVSGIQAQPVKGAQSSSNYEKQFNQVWETVRDRFYDKNIHGLDWKKIGDTYRAQLPQVKSKEEFQDLINRMLDELHASHTTYITDNDVEFYMLPAVIGQDMQGHKVEHIGIMGHQAAKEFIVAGVLDGGPAQKAGIQSGDHLLTADGQPFSSAGSFKDKEGKSVEVVLKREGEAAVRTISVTPVKQNVLRAFLNATETSARVIETGGKKIGYVHLWTMANDAFKRTLDGLVVGKLHDTDGLILDLRDGYGGTPFGYTDVFFRPDVAWEQHVHGQPPNVSHTGYGKPVVVLINGGTRSAKEFFTYQMKTAHRAVVVGTKTAGAFLGAGGFEIGKDGLLELAVVGLRVDGNLLEVNGVTPDIEVPANATYSERDKQMAVATQKVLELISRRVTSGDKNGVGAH